MDLELRVTGMTCEHCAEIVSDSGAAPRSDRGAKLSVAVIGTVARMLRDACPAGRLGRRRLKNVSAPVEVYEIRRA